MSGFNLCPQRGRYEVVSERRKSAHTTMLWTLCFPMSPVDYCASMTTNRWGSEPAGAEAVKEPSGPNRLVATEVQFASGKAMSVEVRM